MDKNLADFKGKRVILVQNLSEPDENGHGTVELEGEVQEASNEVGVFFRQRGRTNGVLIKTADIEDIRIFEAPPKPVKIKELKKMTPETVRQHLADRHAASVKMLNERPDDVAMKMHDELHAAHGDDISHRHGSPGFRPVN